MVIKKVKVLKNISFLSQTIIILISIIIVFDYIFAIINFNNKEYITTVTNADIIIFLNSNLIFFQVLTTFYFIFIVSIFYEFFI